LQDAIENLEVEILKFRNNIDRLTAEAILRINKMQHEGEEAK